VLKKGTNCDVWLREPQALLWLDARRLLVHLTGQP